MSEKELFEKTVWSEYEKMARFYKREDLFKIGEDGHYADNDISAMWYGWRLRSKQNVTVR